MIKPRKQSCQTVCHNVSHGNLTFAKSTKMITDD